MPIYLVPLASIDLPPRAPAILLGRVPATAKTFVEHRFGVAVPRTVRLGRYRVAVICAACLSGPAVNVILANERVTVTHR